MSWNTHRFTANVKHTHTLTHTHYHQANCTKWQNNDFYFDVIIIITFVWFLLFAWVFRFAIVVAIGCASGAAAAVHWLHTSVQLWSTIRNTREKNMRATQAVVLLFFFCSSRPHYCVWRIKRIERSTERHCGKVFCVCWVCYVSIRSQVERNQEWQKRQTKSLNSKDFQNEKKHTNCTLKRCNTNGGALVVIADNHQQNIHTHTRNQKQKSRKIRTKEMHDRSLVSFFIITTIIAAHSTQCFILVVYFSVSHC